MAKLRILIGDDHTLFRQGIRKILEEKPEWEVVAEAGDGREVVRLTLAETPDIVVLDIGMPLLNGIEATRQIARCLPDTRVLIVSMHRADAYVAQALKAGAKGFLLKDSAGNDLIQAISAVAAGKSYFSPAVTELIVGDYSRRAAEASVTDGYDTLSQREREVFQLVAEGYTNREMAEMLSISPATVETHRARILDKLGVHNTAELVLYAVRRGVIS